jgi:hypothetical protein
MSRAATTVLAQLNLFLSNMEIWCECFGKDRANLRRLDGNEISAIMAGIGGWSGLVRKERIPLYGPQWLYVLKP